MTARQTEDWGGLGEDSTALADLISDHGWSRQRLVSELRKVAATHGQALPTDDSLKRMIRQWVNGNRAPSDEYRQLLGEALGVTGRPVAPADEQPHELAARWESPVDRGMVELLARQTEGFRQLDRRLGAKRVLAQVEGHVRNMADLVRWAPFGAIRQELAKEAAAAASLAGWQALDLGRPRTAWEHYDRARSLAHEAGDVAVVAHVTAEQGYALLDIGDTTRAVEHFAWARKSASTRAPGVVLAWLAAAEAEALSAAGRAAPALALLDQADRLLTDDEQPGIILDTNHLARWRGHCLARLGHPEATHYLAAALAELPPDFTRAAAGLHTDLATAYMVRNDPEAARVHAAEAQRLSGASDSVRQARRLQQLLARSEGKDVQ